MTRETNNSIRRRGASQYERDTIGISKVIIPPGMDRALYIEHCYQCGTVSIISRVNMDIIHDVNVDTSCLGRINFPDNSEELGSTVVVVNLPIYNSPVIVGVLNASDEMPEVLEEGEFSFSKFNESGQVSISGKARGGQIDIIAQSNSDSGGRMRVNVSNKSGTAVLDVVVNGAIMVKGTSIETKARDFHNISVTDGKEGTKRTFLDIDKDTVETRIQEGTSGHKFTEEGYEIGEATEAATLGDSLKDFTDALIDVIASQTVATSMGPQPLVNAAGITQMKQQTINFLSTYLKIE